MSQIVLQQMTGPASAAGTALATQNPTETGTWTEVPAVTAAIPPGGAMLRATADTATFRVAIVTNGRALPPTPPHNGYLVPLGATYSEVISPDTRVFVRTP
jgi:hypothetical protein